MGSQGRVRVLRRSGACGIPTFTPYAPWGRRVLTDELRGPRPWVHSPLRKDPRAAASGVGRRRPCPVRQEDRALTQSAGLHVRPLQNPFPDAPRARLVARTIHPCGHQKPTSRGTAGGVSLVSYGAFLGDGSVHPVGPPSLSRHKRGCSGTQGGLFPQTAAGTPMLGGRHGTASGASGIFQARGSLQRLPNAGGVATRIHTGPSASAPSPGQTVPVPTGLA